MMKFVVEFGKSKKEFDSYTEARRFYLDNCYWKNIAGSLIMIDENGNEYLYSALAGTFVPLN